jgi:hypothetical protein
LAHGRIEMVWMPIGMRLIGNICLAQKAQIRCGRIQSLGQLAALIHSFRLSTLLAALSSNQSPSRLMDSRTRPFIGVSTPVTMLSLLAPGTGSRPRRPGTIHRDSHPMNSRH